MKILPPERLAGAVLAALLFGTGCLGIRLKALETRVDALGREQKEGAQALEAQTLRSDSVAVGLEKMSQRVDQVSPPSAQWMKLVKGATIKWYLDELDQNVYVQYLEPGPQAGSVKLSISTGAGAKQQVLRPGEAVEHRWTTEAGTRSFIVTCHRILYADDGAVHALLSIMKGPVLGTG